jgi:hypothetical protein
MTERAATVERMVAKERMLMMTDRSLKTSWIRL